MRTGVTRRIGHVVLLVALAAVPVLALNSLATADTGTDPHASTDTHRQCLAEQGVTGPARTAAQRQELREAAQACSFHGGLRPLLRRLTDQQRQCLTDQGVTLPARSADGSRPSLSADQRAALVQAADACGLTLRAPHPRGGGGDQI
jgi:hypothetical protein